MAILPLVKLPLLMYAFCEPVAVEKGVAHANEPLADESEVNWPPTLANRGSGTPRDVHVKLTVSPGKNVVGETLLSVM